MMGTGTLSHAPLIRDFEIHSSLGFTGIRSLKRDDKDGEIGVVGYEINFNRYFYKYEPPRPLEEIDADLEAVEKEIQALLEEVTE